MPDFGSQVDGAQRTEMPALSPPGTTGTGLESLARIGNQSLAQAISRRPQRGRGGAAAGGRCACGGTILPGGECSKCLSRRMKAKGSSDGEVHRAIVTRMALADGAPGASIARSAEAQGDHELSLGMAEAARRRDTPCAGGGCVRAVGVRVSAAPSRTAARGPLDWLEQRAEDVGEAVGGAAEWVGDRAQDVGEAVGDAAEWVGDRAEDVGEAVGDAAEWVGDRAEDVGEAVGDAAEWVGDRAEDVGEAVEDAAGDAAEWVEDRAAGAREWVRERAEELNPFGGGGPRTARKIRAQAICKCVGDDKCGGGKIHKKYFHVEDCRDAKLEAEKICNNDPEMKEKCIRPQCYYRHGDYKCPA
ncbi:hypothetical protein OM076_13420 [Solirubrobacter ginsenosidimutans]|uniref:Uncharacterized protein n=1 Tax=Solirubrobacter ginsenosidimutans TaxID=490573 RepID=A0A9X3MQU8_9ACTN|nr:hypothetical protein [Solirubrobacter ginsenosidimutans]MDA0161271.1 hypothetical protein [Solirubrobacter ginsenosidimutans]